MGATLFFAADDGTNGRELWKSDGTPEGTVIVRNIGPGAAAGDPYELTAVGSTLFFGANDGTNGYELWKSNGTEGGTVLVENLNASGDAKPDPLRRRLREHRHLGLVAYGPLTTQWENGWHRDGTGTGAPGRERSESSSSCGQGMEAVQ